MVENALLVYGLHSDALAKMRMLSCQGVDNLHIYSVGTNVVSRHSLYR